MPTVRPVRALTSWRKSSLKTVWRQKSFAWAASPCMTVSAADHQRDGEKKKRNQLFFEFRRRKYSFMQHPHTADSDLQCRRADSKEQHPNQKADKAAVEKFVRHRLN